MIFHTHFIFFQVGQIQYFTKSLTCTKIGNQLYNPYDLRIKCYDADTLKFNYPFSITILLFRTFLPLLVLYNIKKNKNKLNECTIKYKYGYYYEEFQREYYYWEFIRTYLKILLIYIYTIIQPYYQITSLVGSLIIIGLYLKVVQQTNPFFSKTLQKSEILCYLLIVIKLFLSGLKLDGDNKSILFANMIQFIIDYSFFSYCFFSILLLKIKSKSSKLGMFLMMLITKILPKKCYESLQNNISFRTFYLWRLIYRNLAVITKLKPELYSNISQLNMSKKELSRITQKKKSYVAKKIVGLENTQTLEDKSLIGGSPFISQITQNYSFIKRPQQTVNPLNILSNSIYQTRLNTFQQTKDISKQKSKKIEVLDLSDIS
ncbi:transmembrane protein, putative (macronuclear) [Tetrahymena thermophila SB210]|uniref:Transmembrane protein, putative n=1 Tax=Tetrahymena thermophila (strain SB210) TaxID=312017 RepID=W7XH90_TETTS|nr:transmembrane protein, putative [Tetrahymena thermophila SB210]EWS76548.1 transmembrane protein, putative [Tetrahymena thermophila SB210]|eukprot:XP_012650920.1 transmembrane protein, putative [Tetrahymena thermophila SB210]